MRRLLPLVFLPALFLHLQAAPSQVEFTALVTAVNSVSDTEVELSMSLTADTQITVRVTDQTEIEDQNSVSLTLAELMVGMTLTVDGVFTDSGILAQKIEVAGSERDFEFRGMIESLDAAAGTITVRGFSILVPESAEIKDDQGNLLLFSELQVGQRVRVEGMVTNGALTASEIQVLLTDRNTARITVEGIVTAISGDDVTVSIESVGPTLIRITTETEIRGDLAVGVRIRASGTIQLDLSIRARRIVVLSGLKVAPERLKLGVNKTRRVEIILRAAFNVDAEISITSQDPSLAQPSTDKVVIPAGKVEGSFDVTAGDSAGDTIIEVQLSDALGGETARVKVSVKRESDKSGKTLEARFVPDEVNMGVNQTRRVKLRLNQAPAQDVSVDLTLKEGPADLVVFPSMVTIMAGSRLAEVEIQSGANRGQVTIVATLPAAEGEDEAELEVKVRKERSGDSNDSNEDEDRSQLQWVPQEIRAGLNETVEVKLVLNRAAASDFTVILTAKEKRGDLVTFPSEVRFVTGTSEVTVKITTGGTAGETEIKAALPFSEGGGTAELKIKVGDTSDSS